MYILGINNGFHDASAAILHDGHLIYMIEQERLSRRKRALEEFPLDAIAACLNAAHLGLEDIDAIAIGWNQVFTETYQRHVPFDRFTTGCLPPIHYIPHHLAHAASAYWTSGMERAAVLVVDGRGETQPTTLALGTPEGIQILREWDFTQSLGEFYAIAAQWAGFTFWDAGKLMGLACYGQPLQSLPITITPDGYTIEDVALPGKGEYERSRDTRADIWMRRKLNRYFQRQNYPFQPADKLDVMAYATFAASVQKALEEAVLRLVSIVCEQTGLDTLVFAGGVAMNCTLNGRLARSSLLRDFYVPPFPYDAGVSVGAALQLYSQLSPGSLVSSRLDHAYWAPPTSHEQLEQALSTCNFPARSYPLEELLKQVIKHLLAGHIICWFQGRAEVGQRALGARSILCDPRKRKHLVRLNTLKGRELWRPLAPSIQAEYAADLFATPLSSAAAFMLAAYPVRADAQSKLPAVVHVDGSARPQVISQRTQPLLWNLLDRFRHETGVPALINTSFNLAGEPIVYTPADALSTFLRSEFDVLVLDDYLLVKSQAILED